jgi:hypothetical protein
MHMTATLLLKKLAIAIRSNELKIVTIISPPGGFMNLHFG